MQNRAHGTFERLDKWVADNLVDSEADLQVPGLTAAMGLAAPVVNYALDFGSTAYDHRAEQLVEQAQRHAVESAARASGNPEVRAGYLPPRELVVERRLARSGTMAAAERFGRVGRVLGTVVTGRTVSEYEARVPGLERGLPWLSAEVPIARASIPLTALLVIVGVGVGLVSRSWEMLILVGVILLLLGSVAVGSKENWRGSAGRVHISGDRSGIWFAESAKASRARLVLSIVMVAILVPVVMWGIFRLAAGIFVMVFGALLLDSFVRWRDRRRFGLCGEGLWWRTWWGGWRFVSWGEVGFPQFDGLRNLVIPVGRQRPVTVARLETDSDVRAIWGMVVFYRANPERRGELVDGSFVRTVSSGVLPLPQ